MFKEKYLKEIILSKIRRSKDYIMLRDWLLATAYTTSVITSQETFRLISCRKKKMGEKEKSIFRCRVSSFLHFLVLKQAYIDNFFRRSE
jgi:hypothetical protein